MANRKDAKGKDSNPPGNQRILSDHSSSSIGGVPFSDLSGRLVGSKPKGPSLKLAERSLKRAIQVFLLANWHLAQKTFQH